MPWCDDCAKFWSPASMRRDGACPTCGRVLVEPPPTAEGDDDTPTPPAPTRLTAGTVDVRELAGESGRAPWHFKVLVGLVVAYLAWRGVQMATWLF
jgi:hypothetical protein